jgi:hypothetical protein
MGAAASIEGAKPIDASDIQPLTLFDSKCELIRLRHLLGHLAAQAGIEAVVLDASDVVLGVNEAEDHHRCCDAVRHIRAALRLGTQNSKRVARSYAAVSGPSSIFRVEVDQVGGSSSSDSDGDDPHTDTTSRGQDEMKHNEQEEQEQ